MEENTLAIKKHNFQTCFLFYLFEVFFINSTKHVFLKQKQFSKIQFPNTIFFFENTKNCF